MFVGACLSLTGVQATNIICRLRCQSPRPGCLGPSIRGESCVLKGQVRDSVQGVRACPTSTRGDDCGHRWHAEGESTHLFSFDAYSRAPQEAIEDHASERGDLPPGIVIFRDGVSEGEYEKVERSEIDIIEGTNCPYLPHSTLIPSIPLHSNACPFLQQQDPARVHCRRKEVCVPGCVLRRSMTHVRL